MLPIAYTISPYLTRFLERTEVARRHLVLAPLPPRRELELQFAASVNRIDYGLRLMDKVVQTRTIGTILANQIAFAMQKKKDTNDPTQNLVLGYKQALDIVRRDWLVTGTSVKRQDLEHIYRNLKPESWTISEKQVEQTLSYVQNTSDNPYIQAAIAKLLFRQLFTNDPYAESFSTICSYLFLYRGGMDCRRLLIMEQSWIQDRKLFEGHYHTGIAKSNITSWIEYFIKGLALSLETTQQKLYQNVQLTDHKDISKLNERQKTIVSLLDDPNAIITNRTVQKIFHISQITASRDLAKLTSLGLLFTQGKGRSVRYTRI